MIEILNQNSKSTITTSVIMSDGRSAEHQNSHRPPVARELACASAHRAPIVVEHHSAACTKSASDDICCSPNSRFNSANTRSHDAELGEMANTTRAASAHALNELPLVRHHLRMASDS